MSAKRRRTPRDARRRRLGQNFLVDRSVIDALVRSFDVQPNELIVDLGAGSGALTIPLAAAGARVIAVELDSVWALRLERAAAAAGVGSRVRIVRGDLRTVALPRRPFRVVSNPPFRLTTELLARLLDDPDRGPRRIDVLVQHEVARKRAATPPAHLRTAAWAPWWTFQVGLDVPRSAFRPVPAVDASVLTVRRRRDDVLPSWLAPRMRELLRPGWKPPPKRRDTAGRAASHRRIRGSEQPGG